MKLTIEQPKTEAAEELSKLSFASKRHWGYPEEWIELWREDLTITAEKIKTRDYWVGRIGEELIFVYSVSHIADDTYDLEDFWLAPAHIGQGYGRLMFDHLRTTLQDLGCTKLMIVSDPHAESFYRKMGAVRVGQQASTPEGRMLPVLMFNIR